MYKKVIEPKNLLELFLKTYSVEELKCYDLKMQMMEYENVKNYLYSLCPKLEVNKEDIDGCFIDKNKAIERYLLFKLQYKRNGFDCDHLNYKNKEYSYFEDISITDAFFHKYKCFDCPITDPKDTLFSLQSIWGRIIENLVMTEEEHKMSQEEKFIWEFKNISLIKEKLQQYKIKKEDKEINLYQKLNEFAYLYHTIGNMSPCPSGPKINNHTYNQNKGTRGEQFDRLDLFIEKKSDIFKNYEYWFTKENIDKFALQNIMYIKDENLSKIVPIPKIVNGVTINIEEIMTYLDNMINLIQTRADVLLNKVKNNE